MSYANDKDFENNYALLIWNILTSNSVSNNDINSSIN